MSTTTEQNSEKEGVGRVWEMDMESVVKKFQESIGTGYENNATYKMIIALFEKAKEQEIKFHDQTSELKLINDKATKLIKTVKEDTADFKEKIKGELGLWRYFIIGALVVVGISFISLTIDTFWRRNDEFHKMNLEYNERMLKIEDKIYQLDNLNLFLQKEESILNCLKDKAYFSISCFK